MMTILPKQRVSAAFKKRKDWQEGNLNYYIGRSQLGFSMDRQEYSGLTKNSVASRIYDMLVNYDIYNSRFLQSDMEHLSNPFGAEEGKELTFPTVMQNVNITRPAIDLLIGEKSRRVTKPIVLDTSPEMVDQLLEMRKGMIVDNVIAEIQNEIDPESRHSVIPMEKIDEYVYYTHKNIYEKAGQFMINRCRRELDIDDLFLEVWKDSLISGEGILYAGAIGGVPVAEKCNPVYCDYERHPGMWKIEEAQWFVRKMYKTIPDIYDLWDISKEEDEILCGNGGLSVLGFGDMSSPIITKRANEDIYNTMDAVPVYHVVWRSQGKVGFAKWTDPDGEEQVEIVGEGFKAPEGVKVEWMWESEMWEGWKIGNTIYKDVRRIPSQIWPYYGNIMSNTNSKNVSLVGLMKPLQYWFLEVMYRLQLTLARDKGKVINIDVTQIPKSLGVDFTTWAHYLSFLGVNLINPYEEGWDIKRGSGPAGFNQFGSVDLTMANVINEYVSLLGKIESMIGRISGVPDQRLGEIKASELVGNVERTITQSATVTEPYFIKQLSLERRFYNALLEITKQSASREELKMLDSFDSVTRDFITIPSDMSFRDMGIFVGNTNEEYSKLQMLKGFAESALSAGASLSEAIMITVSDSVAEIKAKVKEIDQKREEAEQQKAQAEQEAMNKQIEGTLAMKERELGLKEYDINMRSQTAIQVKAMDTDVDDNGQDDSVQIEKLELEREKLIASMRQKSEELSFKKDKLREDTRIKEKQLNKKPSGN